MVANDGRCLQVYKFKNYKIFCLFITINCWDNSLGRIKWQLHTATTVAKAPNKSLSLQFTDIRPIPISLFPMGGQLSYPADCALLLEQGSAARLCWQQMSPARKTKMFYYIYLNSTYMSTLCHFGIGEKLHPGDENLCHLTVTSRKNSLYIFW